MYIENKNKKWGTSIIIFFFTFYNLLSNFAEIFAYKRKIF